MGSEVAIRHELAGIGERGATPHDLGQLMDIARTVVRSELCPQSLRKPEDAFVVMAYGLELGFQPIKALQMLDVVKGKVRMPGATCAALIQASPACRDYRIWFEGDGDARAACVQSWRKGRDQANEVVRFTLAQAKAAGLYPGKPDKYGNPPVWQTYTDDMLKWKAVARDAANCWGDVTHGLKITEDYAEADASRHVEARVIPRRDTPDPALALLSGEPPAIDVEETPEAVPAGIVTDQPAVNDKQLAALETLFADLTSEQKAKARKGLKANLGTDELMDVPADAFDRTVSYLKNVGNAWIERGGR